MLIRVEACALCGSDRHALESGAPVTPGHETAGEVVETGPGVDAPRPGTRGIVYLVDFCGACAACRRGWTNVCLDRRRMYGFDASGGFADYQVVRAGCFVPVDPRVRPGQATALLDLLGTAGHALRRAGPPPPRRVLVLGCGPIGLGALAMSAALGIAERYGVDLAGHRLELVERLGAVPVDAAKGEEEVDERTGGRFDEQTDRVADEVRGRGEGILGDQQADEPSSSRGRQPDAICPGEPGADRCSGGSGRRGGGGPAATEEIAGQAKAEGHGPGGRAAHGAEHIPRHQHPGDHATHESEQQGSDYCRPHPAGATNFIVNAHTPANQMVVWRSATALDFDHG